MKDLAIYLNWSKITLGIVEAHILNICLGPGHESLVVKRVDTVTGLIKSIIRQDVEAKVIIRGYMNG